MGSLVQEGRLSLAFPKTDYYRSKAMMDAVRDFPCGHCGRTVEGTCGAHPNWHWASKGKSIKAHDIVAALCPTCHTELDQGKNWTREERKEAWARAFFNTMLHGFRSGTFEVKRGRS